MPNTNESEERWYPEEVRIITDLETLQTVADPLRLRILALLRREPHTVKALAQELDIAPTKLYYHIKLLEERGLIGVAATRPGPGPAEKEYGVTAYRLSVDRALLSPDAPAVEDARDTFLSLVLDHSKSEIKRSVRAGLIDPDPAKTDPTGLTLGRLWMRLTPEEAASFHTRLKALEEEYMALHPLDTAEPGVQFYELLSGFYATLPPEQEDTSGP